MTAGLSFLFKPHRLNQPYKIIKMNVLSLASNSLKKPVLSHLIMISPAILFVKGKVIMGRRTFISKFFLRHSRRPSPRHSGDRASARKCDRGISRGNAVSRIRGKTARFQVCWGATASRLPAGQAGNPVFHADGMVRSGFPA